MVIRKNILKAILPIGLISISLASEASVIEFSTSFSNNNLSNYGSTTGSSFGDANATTALRELQRFDGTLGQLTDVEISYSTKWAHTSYASAYDSSASSTAFRRSYSCGFFNLSTCYTTYYRYSNDTAVNMTSRATFDLSLDDPFRSTATRIDSNYDNCSRSYIAGFYNTYVGCSDRTNSSYIDFSGTLDLSMFTLDQFVGTDNLNFSLTNTANMYGSCDNNDAGDSCLGYNDAYWYGNITVKYTYETSAPGALVLLLIGLMTVGGRKILK